MTDPASLLEPATAIARAAGAILQQFAASGSAWVSTKSNRVDLVTEADEAAEALIVERIHQARPHDAVFGEEGAEVTGTSGVRWVVDPLDGTVNFTYGIPSYAVSIGIEIDGSPAIGVVFNPATDELFTAVAGGGAFRNGRPIRARSENDLGRALVATGFSYDEDNRRRQAELLQRVLPAARDIRRAGSAALDLCAVACGRVDAYYELVVNPWDVRAGGVIATEAGARVTAIDGGRPDNTVVAANPALYKTLLALIS